MPAGATQFRAPIQSRAPAMGNIGEPNLSEEAILALLAARRRAARLQSLQRVSALGRTATLSQTAALTLPPPQLAVPGPAPVPHTSAGTRLPESAMPANAGDSIQRIAAGGWLARTQVTVQPQHLHPLGHDASRSATSYWTAAVRRQPWGLWRDRALLLVELAALVALVYVVAGSFSSMGDLNVELADARRAPVAVDVPVALAVALAAPASEEELPGSSAPPSPGSDAPGPLRSPVQLGAMLPIATPGAQAASRIVIPSIGVNSVIVEGDTWEDLKKGVGHHAGTSNAGEKGNAVYSGHDDVYGEVFRRLEELKLGDVITVYAGAQLYRYEVKRTRLVSPKETSVLAVTADATLTLITCYPYRVDTQRLVVVAKLVE
jgi:sortase A